MLSLDCWPVFFFFFPKYYISPSFLPVILICDQFRPRLLFTTKFDGLTRTGNLLRNMEPSIPTRASRGETVESAGGSTSTPRPTRWFTCISHELWPQRKVASRLFTGYADVRPSGLLVLTSEPPFVRIALELLHSFL